MLMILVKRLKLKLVRNGIFVAPIIGLKISFITSIQGAWGL
jgi:hypothetical protein